MKNTPSNKLPFVSLELVVWLEAVFPQTAMDIDPTQAPTTDAIVVHGLLRSGEQRVIRKLRSILNEQSNNAK